MLPYPKRIIRKKWRAEEEERHKGSLTQKGAFYTTLRVGGYAGQLGLRVKDHNHETYVLVNVAGFN
jgi:hypothetical protein